MRARVRWHLVVEVLDPRWLNNYGLYVYLTPDGSEILYVGKVDGYTVRQRLRAPDKMALRRALERERGHFRHVVIVGEIEFEAVV